MPVSYLVAVSGQRYLACDKLVASALASHFIVATRKFSTIIKNHIACPPESGYRAPDLQEVTSLLASVNSLHPPLTWSLTFPSSPLSWQLTHPATNSCSPSTKTSFLTGPSSQSNKTSQACRRLDSTSLSAPTKELLANPTTPFSPYMPTKMVRATKAKQPAGLVFVNIGHPDETKTSEFREKVARTAMINRPREAAPATTTKAPSKPTKAAASKAGAASSSSSATKATTSSRPIPPPRHASSTPSITSLGGHQNSLTSPDEVVATTAASPQYGFAYQQASPPALEYAIASPESADLSPPSLFQYNSHDSNNNFASNPQHADNSYFRNYDLANTNANGSATQYAMNGYTSPPIVTSPPSDDSNSYSATHKSTSIDSSTSSRSIAKIRKEKRSESNSTNNNTQGLQVARKKAFKQKHNPSVTGMISGIPDFVVRDWNNDTNPTRSVGAILDPFDALPVKANAHTQELLYQYVNAYLMSPQLGERGSPIHTRLTLSRQKLWWPMVMRSKAALCALSKWLGNFRALRF